MTVARPADLVLDDGFYYLGIARHLAEGHGSTWDGLHPTNGYHPLWLGLLTAVSAISSSTGVTLSITFTLQACLLVLSCVLLTRLCHLILDAPDTRRIPSLAASWIAVALWIGLTYRLALGGLELMLNVTCLLLAALYYLRWFGGAPPPTVRYLSLGLLLAAAFLARLDNALLALTVPGREALRLFRPSAPPALPRLLALAGPPAVTALVYAGLQVALFGHPLPVSGAVKTRWSELALAQDPLAEHGVLWAKAAHLAWPLSSPGVWSLALVAGTAGLGILWLARHRLGLERLEPLAPFILFSNLGYATYALLYHGRWSTTPWYYAIQPLLAALLLAILIDRWGRAGRHWAAVTTLLLLALIWRTFAGFERNRPGPGPVFDALADLPGDTLLASWNPGALGYLSGRPVINLDGLVNSWDYFLTDRHDLCAYWRATGVTHLVDVFDLDRRPPTPLYPGYDEFHEYRACAEDLHVIWTDPRFESGRRVAILELR